MRYTIISLLFTLLLSSGQAYSETLAKSIILNYANLAERNYQDAYHGALKLDQGIKRFISRASSNGTTQKELESLYAQLKNQWANEARIPYGQSEIFRFYYGPIDFESIDDGYTTFLESINFEGVEGLLNAWPLDEAYIDYVSGNKKSGVINDRSIPITKEQLTVMNERNGEKNISTGYHAIEFLLWGQDRSITTAGQRTYKDYVAGPHARNQDRRRQYLSLTSSIMLEHLQSVHKQWLPAMVNFRQEFESKPLRYSLKDIFTSLIAMSGDELKSERIENALLLEDQEEEHSCFSDKTINDIYANAKGVMNIYMGEYRSFNRQELLSGPGVSLLVAESNKSLDLEIKKVFKSLMNNINYFYRKDQQGQVVIGDIIIPFDVAITGHKVEIQRIVDDLGKLDTLLRKAAQTLGITLAV